MMEGKQVEETDKMVMCMQSLWLLLKMATFVPVTKTYGTGSCRPEEMLVICIQSLQFLNCFGS